jgi:hypothetical protein
MWFPSHELVWDNMWLVWGIGGNRIPEWVFPMIRYDEWRWRSGHRSPCQNMTSEVRSSHVCGVHRCTSVSVRGDEAISVGKNNYVIVTSRLRAIRKLYEVIQCALPRSDEERQKKWTLTILWWSSRYRRYPEAYLHNWHKSYIADSMANLFRACTMLKQVYVIMP